jgi:hypothetical protein
VRLQGWGRGAEEEALGGIGDAGRPVHCARPRRLHHRASMIPRLPPPQQTGKRLKGGGCFEEVLPGLPCAKEEIKGEEEGGFGAHTLAFGFD